METQQQKDDRLLDEKIRAEINKIVAETAKINKETRWYELVIISGVVVALIAAGKYLL